MESFNEKIRTVRYNAISFLEDTIRDSYIELPEDNLLKALVILWDDDPCHIYIRYIRDTAVEDNEGEEYAFDELTAASIAKVADYVMEHRDKIKLYEEEE